MARRLKPSETIWITSAVIGAIVVLLIDWWLGVLMGFWPTIIIWVLVAGGTYSVALKTEAQRTIVDKLK